MRPHLCLVKPFFSLPVDSPFYGGSVDLHDPGYLSYGIAVPNEIYGFEDIGMGSGACHAYLRKFLHYAHSCARVSIYGRTKPEKIVGGLCIQLPPKTTCRASTGEIQNRLYNGRSDAR